MKKNIIVCIIMLSLLSISVLSYVDEPTYSMAFSDNDRTSGYDWEGGSPFSEIFTTLNFTCGGRDVGVFGYSSLLNIDIDGADSDEVLIMCDPDSQNTKAHGIIMNSSADAIGFFDLSPTLSIPDSGLGIITSSDIDNDGKDEIISLMASSNNLELIIHEWINESIVVKKNIEIQDSSVSASNFTLSGIENVTEQGDFDGVINVDIMCYDKYCLLTAYREMILVDVQAEVGLWGKDLDTDYGVTFSVTNDAYTSVPIITDIDYDSDMEIIFYDRTSDYLYVFDLLTGDIEFSSYISSQVSTGTHLKVYDCATSQCNAAYKELLFNEGDSQCELYKFDTYSENGTISSIRNTAHDQSSPEDMVCWVEDRDIDGTKEVCSLGFDKSGNTYSSADVRCEEISLFGFDTIDESFSFTLSDHSAVLSDMILSDFSGDGILDILGSGFLLNMETESVVQFNQNNSVDMSGQAVVPMLGSSDELIIFSRSGELEDEVYLSSTGSIEGIEINNPIVWDEGAERSPADPVCQNATIEFKCNYFNDCVTDNEFDDFQIEVDCASDGSILSGTRYYGDDHVIGCQVPQSDGVYNATLWVYDDVNGINVNDTMYIEYIVNDSASCNEDSNLTGSNNRPEWTSFPTTDIPSPFCSGSGVTYDIEGAYSDVEDDDVYLKIDCDEDGVYEGLSSVNPISFSCIVDDTIDTISVQICDKYHTSDCDSVTWSISVSSRTFEDVLLDCDVNCGDPRLYQDGVVIDVCDLDDIPYFLSDPYRQYESGTPVCEGQVVGFSCENNSCYDSLDNDLDVQIQVDCESDGILDYVLNEEDYPEGFPEFLCLYDEDSRSHNVSYDNGSSIWTYNASFILYVPGWGWDWQLLGDGTWAIVNLYNDNVVSEFGEILGSHEYDGIVYYGKNLVRTLPVRVSDNLSVCSDISDFEDILGVGNPCDNDTMCKTGYCFRGYCSLRSSGEECANDYECMSEECINGKCSKPSLAQKMNQGKDEAFGDDKATGNIISIVIILFVVAIIVIGVPHIGGVVLAGGVGIVMSIGFVLLGWMSGLILIGLFIFLVVAGTFITLLVVGGG